MYLRFFLLLAFFVIGAALLFWSKNIMLVAEEFAKRFSIYIALEKGASVGRVRMRLKQLNFVKEFFFVPKEDALRELSMLLQTEDVEHLLGYNPLPSGFVVRLKPQFFKKEPKELLHALSAIKGTKLFLDKESLFLLSPLLWNLSFFLKLLYAATFMIFLLLLRNAGRLPLFGELSCFIAGLLLSSLFSAVFLKTWNFFEWIGREPSSLSKGEFSFLSLTAASLMLLSRVRR